MYGASTASYICLPAHTFEFQVWKKRYDFKIWYYDLDYLSYTHGTHADPEGASGSNIEFPGQVYLQHNIIFDLNWKWWKSSGRGDRGYFLQGHYLNGGFLQLTVAENNYFSCHIGLQLTGRCMLAWKIITIDVIPKAW